MENLTLCPGRQRLMFSGKMEDGRSPAGRTEGVRSSIATQSVSSDADLADREDRQNWLCAPGSRSAHGLGRCPTGFVFWLRPYSWLGGMRRRIWAPGSG